MKVLVENKDNKKYIIEIVEKKDNKILFSVDSITYIGDIVSELENNKDITAKFVRYATEEDINKIPKIKKIEEEAVVKGRELVAKYNLEMDIISSHYDFDGKQLLIEFFSVNRVDFRNLAKDLASIYKTRIELRQVGIRDKAKIVGGYGPCGKKLCCQGHLNKFESVSINMAKNQNISLNPNKINGVCGRLLCCLKYENDEYSKCKKCLPKKGSKIETKKGKGTVIDVNILSKTYKVNIEKVGVLEFTCGED